MVLNTSVKHIGLILISNIPFEEDLELAYARRI